MRTVLILILSLTGWLNCRSQGLENKSQLICYNTRPSTLSGSAASCGTGTTRCQWKYSTYGRGSCTNVSGATLASYQPGNLKQKTLYKRIDSDNLTSKESNVVTITVRNSLSPGMIPQSHTVCYGDNVLTITATVPTGGSGDYSYQWKSSPNNSSWSNINGATSANLTLGTLTSTTYFKRVVTDRTCGEKESNICTVTVKPELTTRSISSAQSICYNTAPELITGTAATGSNLVYQWQESANGTTWRDIEGATVKNYQPGALTATTHYKSITTGDCGLKESEPVTITVMQELTAGVIGSNQVVLLGSRPKPLNTSIPANGGNGSLSYQWQYKTEGNNWVNVSSGTSENYQPDNLTETTEFKRLVSDRQCGEAESNVVTITVKDQLKGGSIEADQTICYNSLPELIIGTSATGGNLSSDYVWQYSTNGGNTWHNIATASSEAYQPEALTETTLYKRQVIDTQCGIANSNTVTITVNPQLKPGIIAGQQSINYNAQPSELRGTDASGGNGVYRYWWEQSADNSSWEEIPQSNSINFQPGQLMADTYYKRGVESCETTYSNTICVTVGNELRAGTISAPQTICYNTLPGKLQCTEATGGAGIYDYVWQQSADGGENWQTLYGNSLLEYQPRATTEKTLFRVKVNSGEEETFSEPTYIDPLPAVTLPEVQGLKEAYCKNDEFSLSVNTPHTVIWCNFDREEIGRQSVLHGIADQSTSYYYQIENTAGCKSELKEIPINVDFMEGKIKTNATNEYSVVNGERLTILESTNNLSPEELDYTWTFTNQDYGWYETMFNPAPSEYFHWKGWYDTSLEVSIPNGCTYHLEKTADFYVNEETPDTRIKSKYTGKKDQSIDPDLGRAPSMIINVFPNPFDSELFFELNEAEATLLNVDLTGRKVLHRALKKGQNRVETSHLSKGIYLATLLNSQGDRLLTKKLVK